VEEYSRRLQLSRSQTKFVMRVQEISFRPGDVRGYYARHPEEFQVSVPGLFRMIRLDVDRFESRGAAKEKADEILAELNRAPDAASRTVLFAELARKHSSDKNAASGGAWELRTDPDLMPALDAEVRKLRPGELSGVIAQEFGFFVFYLERGADKRLRPFEQVREEIEDRFRIIGRRDRWDEETTMLLRSARLWPQELAKVFQGEEE